MDGYTVTRDGETLAQFRYGFNAWAYLHKVQGQSVVHAVTYEGYDVIYPDGVKLSDIYKNGGAL